MRAKGALLLVTALAIAVLGWFVLHLLAGNLRKEPEQAAEIAGFARWMIDRPWIVPLLALPAAVAAGWMLAHQRSPSLRDPGALRRGLPWIMTAIVTLWLVALFAMILAAFLMYLAPLYQYRELG